MSCLFRITYAKKISITAYHCITNRPVIAKISSTRCNIAERITVSHKYHTKSARKLPSRKNAVETSQSKKIEDFVSLVDNAAEEKSTVQASLSSYQLKHENSSTTVDEKSNFTNEVNKSNNNEEIISQTEHSTKKADVSKKKKSRFKHGAGPRKISKNQKVESLRLLLCTQIYLSYLRSLGFEINSPTILSDLAILMKSDSVDSNLRSSIRALLDKIQDINSTLVDKSSSSNASSSQDTVIQSRRLSTATMKKKKLLKKFITSDLFQQYRHEQSHLIDELLMLPQLRKVLEDPTCSQDMRVCITEYVNKVKPEFDDTKEDRNCNQINAKISSETTMQKRLTPKQKVHALVSLISSSPFLDYYQNKNRLLHNGDLLLIEPLVKAIQTDIIKSELSQKILAYLVKVKVKTVSKNFMDEVDAGTNFENLGDINQVIRGIVNVFRDDLQQNIKKRALDIEAKRKQDMYHRDVAAYVEACVLVGQAAKAQRILLGLPFSGRRRKSKNDMEITDISIYNTLLRAWAKTSKMDEMRQLFEHMEQRNLVPNLQSYAAVLESCGRIKEASTELIHTILNDIRTKGLYIENILIDCSLHADELVYIKKALKAVNPEFLLTPLPPEERMYNCTLLNSLNNNQITKNPHTENLSYEELLHRADVQKSLEEKNVVMVESIQPKVIVTSRMEKARQHINYLTSEKWRHSLNNGFQRALEQLERKPKSNLSEDICPFLRLVPPSVYVDIMMQEITAICQEMEVFSPPVGYLHTKLGTNVYEKMVLTTKQKQKQIKKMTALYKEYLQHFNSEDLHGNLRQIMQRLYDQHSDGSQLVCDHTPWPVATRKAVGRFLMSLIMEEVKVNALIFQKTDDVGEIPAFYSVTRTRNNLPQEEIMPHPVLVRLYKTADIRNIQFQVSDLPCIVPPVPWTSVHVGGNLLCTTDLIKNAPPHFDIHEKVPNQQLFPTFDALNAVSAVPWKINTPMLDLLIKVFNSGGNAKLDIAPPITECPALPIFKSGMTPEERTAVVLERLKLKKKRKEMYSLWCTELYRLSIANKYRDEIFWFPHNIDFRSRFYAVPPHFNHLGSDVARSLLMFAKGKPLGKGGLDWLKIHLINLTGFKKRSPNRERLEYANSIMEEILDSADNPLTGGRWWEDSDEPWQTLSCCKEIANALRSPDPAKYICHFPVHQDGSCNGLQHYAALGRDQSGAESVNLYPFDSPKDVYSDVVELVEKAREKDVHCHNDIAQNLEGFVRRKVIKQTIMTTVYGVTKFGARQQIRGQLEDISDFPQRHVWDSMAYLTDKTFYCLQQMFTSTKKIQDWYVACAELISRIRYEPVQWVTPVGWPVLQPYFRKSHIRLPHQTTKILIEKPNVMKQKNAFPPNYIHSLDSTHMMLTAIQCLQQGVQFVAVHDCFWTHAADVAAMNQICREQFVGLHKEPILEDLAAFLLNKYGFSEEDMREDTETVKQAKRALNAVLGNMPERGAFDIDKVLESTYFFS